MNISSIYSTAIEMTQVSIEANEMALKLLKEQNAPQYHISLTEKLIFHLKGQLEVLKDMKELYEPSVGREKVFTIPVAFH